MTCEKKPYLRQREDGTEVLVVPCLDCPAEVEVPTRSRRQRCAPCDALAKRLRRRKQMAVRLRRRPEEQSPGAEGERQARAVALYLDEGLAVAAIAERLGYSEDGVREALARAGLSTRGDGRSALPFGQPTSDVVY